MTNKALYFIQNSPMKRPPFQELLAVQVQAVLDFVNEAKTIDDLTNIEKHRPDLSKEERSSYSIGEQSAQNMLDTRDSLRGNRFNSIEEILEVKGVGEDKVLDIVEFIWLPTEEIFRQELFKNVLGENWVVNYWRYALDEDEYARLERHEALLKDFVGDKLQAIIRDRTDNDVMGSLAHALLQKSFADKVEGETARIQFASWWYRFDEDNWFSFDRIAEIIEPFLNYYGRQSATYIDLVFYRGFKNGGTVADGITPDDMVVSLNRAESAISIWGISLFD